MRVLVTGGAGFIGSHLVERLVNLEHKVTVVDDLSNGDLCNLHRVKSEIEFFRNDVSTPCETWFEARKAFFDAIFHLACFPRSRSFERPARDVEVNVISTVNVIQLALQCQARVIFSSNSGIYDTSKLPIDESASDSPKTPYDLDKLQSERFLELYRKTFSLDYVVFRFATVYGPRQRVSEEWKPVIMEFITKLKAGQAPIIYWDGEQTRDFIYVDDLLQALISSMGNNKAIGERMILGSGVETSINEIYRTISAQLGVDIEPIHERRQLGDIARMRYSCGKAEQILGWKARTPLSEGISRIISFLD